MNLRYTVNEFFLAHVGKFSFARGKAHWQFILVLVARIVPHLANPLSIGIAR